MWRSRQPDPHEAAKHAEQGAVPVSVCPPQQNSGQALCKRGQKFAESVGGATAKQVSLVVGCLFREHLRAAAT